MEGRALKRMFGSRRIPCEECVVTGENPLCGGTAAHAERTPATARKKKSCGEGRYRERERRGGEGETGRVKYMFLEQIQ